jgi:hypothetical protein
VRTTLRAGAFCGLCGRRRLSPRAAVSWCQREGGERHRGESMSRKVLERRDHRDVSQSAAQLSSTASFQSLEWTEREGEGKGYVNEKSDL